MKKILFIFGGLAILLSACSTQMPNEKKEAPANNNANNATEIQTEKKEEAPVGETYIGTNLNLSGKNLSVFPKEILKNSKIEKLDLSNNQLNGAIPAEIKDLSRLKVLDLSNNLMTGVPAEIGQLANLEELDLSNNQLTGLPYELGNLKNLKVLNISGNDYANADLQIIIEKLPKNTKIIK